MIVRLITIVLFTLSPALNFAADQTFVLAAWNIEHLAANDDTGCRPRDSAEYEAISEYLNRTGADVVAFQEVENLAAAKRVFPIAEYDIHISERPGREFPTCYDSDNNRLMQRTGFAVRKDMVDHLGVRAVRQADVRELDSAYDSGRWGVHLLLERVNGGNITPTISSLHLLSIHLKSRCTYQDSKKPNRDCDILYKQVAALSAWVNVRARLKQDFIIAGDFNRQLDQLSDDIWMRLESGGKSGQYVDLEKALHGIKHPRPYNKKYPYAIDHIIYTQAVDGLALEAATFFDTRADSYSDHLPLFATFDLSRP